MQQPSEGPSVSLSRTHAIERTRCSACTGRTPRTYGPYTGFAAIRDDIAFRWFPLERFFPNCDHQTVRSPPAQTHSRKALDLPRSIAARSRAVPIAQVLRVAQNDSVRP